ncbi:MAG: AAA family ATPase, partial [Anaerolinea sp.]|nr:AAA family ATPase [Anaerolinea sp.]
MADQDKQARGITAIEVKGFKSLRDETRIAIRPLTVLAGANSSGKSSIMQPLLLLKQTLESSPYDRGALKLDGPNVQYTEASQFFSFKTGADESDAHFMLKVTWGGDVSVKNVYQLTSERPRLKLVSTSVYGLDGEETLIHDMPQEEVVRFAEKAFGRRLQNPDLNLSITRFNGFLALVSSSERRLGLLSIFLVPEELTESISQIIHIPGIRTFPSRTYPLVLVTNNRFQGTFENFVAQVLVSWQDAVDPKLDVLFSQLRILSLHPT